MPNTVADKPREQARKLVHVAVAVIIREGRVLIARRPDHVHQGGLLEFPGGKVEMGETVQQALVREIAEETGLRVPLQSLEPVIGIRHDYGDKQVFLDVWRTSAADGEPEGREGQPIDWLRPETLRDEDFPAANRPIIRALNLPEKLLITGAMVSAKDGLSRLAAAVEGRSPGLVVLRAPDLSRQDYRALVKAALKIGSENGIGVLIHGAPELFEHFPGAAGLHLPWREAQGLSGRPVPDKVLLGVSCHGAEQLRHAERLGADYAVLGPVLPTATHPGEPAMGWNVLAELISNAVIPVYALGGMEPGLVSTAKASGAQGIAGIRFWW